MKLLGAPEGFDPTRDAMRIGRAGEHLVCADLILQGYDASIVAAGLPYDIVLDVGRKLYRVQVKSTITPARDIGVTRCVYRFGLRRARGSRQRFDGGVIDVFAFAFLDVRKVAYLMANVVITRDGRTKQTIDWRSRENSYDPTKVVRGLRGCSSSAIRWVEDHERMVLP